MDASAFDLTTEAEADLSLMWKETYESLPEGLRVPLRHGARMCKKFGGVLLFIFATAGCVLAFVLMLGWIALYWLLTQLFLKTAALLRIVYQEAAAADGGVDNPDGSHDEGSNRASLHSPSSSSPPPHVNHVNDAPTSATDMDMFESYLASGDTLSQQRGPLPPGSGQETSVFGGNSSRIEALRRIHEQQAELNANIRAANASTQNAIPTNATSETMPPQPKVPPRGATKAEKKAINQQNWLESLTGKSRDNDSNAKDAAVSSPDRPVEPLATWNSGPPSQAGLTGNTGFGFTSEQMAEAMNFAKSATRGRTSGVSTVNYPKPSTVNIPKSSTVKLPKPSKVKHPADVNRNPLPTSKLLKSYASQVVNPQNTATSPDPLHSTSRTLPPHLRKLQSAKHNNGGVTSNDVPKVASTPSQAIAQAFTVVGGYAHTAVGDQEPQKSMQWAQSMKTHEKQNDSTDVKATSGQHRSSAEFEDWDSGRSSTAPRRRSFEKIFQMKDYDVPEGLEDRLPTESMEGRLSSDVDRSTARTQPPMSIGILKSLNPYSGPQDDSKGRKAFDEDFTLNVERAIEVISGRLPTRPVKQPSPVKQVDPPSHEKTSQPDARSETTISTLTSPNEPIETPAAMEKASDQQRNESSVLATLGIPVANTHRKQPETSKTSSGPSLKHPIGQPSLNRQARLSTDEQRNEPSLLSVLEIKPSRSPAERKGTASAIASSTFKPPSTTSDHFADLFGLEFSSPAASTSSPKPAAPAFSPPTSLSTLRPPAPVFSATAPPFFSPAPPPPAVQTPQKSEWSQMEEVRAPPGLEGSYGASQNTFDALLAHSTGNLNPFETLPQPTTFFDASCNTFDALLSQSIGGSNPYTNFGAFEPSHGASWDISNTQAPHPATVQNTIDAIVAQSGSRKSRGSVPDLQTSALHYRGHDFEPTSIEKLKTFSTQPNLQSRFGPPSSNTSPIRDKDTNTLHKEPSQVMENTSDELEDDSPAKESMPNTHAVHKKRQATRGALARAWQERDDIRKRVRATFTLDGARALEYATKTYNDKRAELAALMATGELREEDEKTFPYHSATDVSAPKKGEGLRGQK